jgi:hypothetical protein
MGICFLVIRIREISSKSEKIKHIKEDKKGRRDDNKWL